MSSTERTRGNRKKAFAEKPSRNLLSKVTKAPVQSWGTDGEKTRPRRTQGHFSGTGEGWREVLTRAEGICEVPVKILGCHGSGEIVGMLGRRRVSQLGLGLNGIVGIS